MTAHADPLTRYAVAPSGCWEWTLHRNPRTGYGVLKAGGEKLYAHRFFYEHYIGPIPAGHDIHHRCENRTCVNPAHLEALPHDEHAGRLTARLAREIRALAEVGWRQRDIAAAYGVGRSTVSDIFRGKRWVEA